LDSGVVAKRNQHPPVLGNKTKKWFILKIF